MSFLAKLKAETMECHVSLEKSLDITQRVKTTEDYRSLLSRFLTIYEPLETALGRAVDWTEAGWKFSAGLKTPWLRADLTALEVSDVEIATWPRCAPAIPLASRGAAIGCLYVVEGSTLGGQMLARQFEDALGITAERGGRFFRGYGAATMPRWREFGVWAEQQALAAGQPFEESAVQSARATFNAFAQWLT